MQGSCLWSVRQAKAKEPSQCPGGKGKEGRTEILISWEEQWRQEHIQTVRNHGCILTPSPDKAHLWFSHQAFLRFSNLTWPTFFIINCLHLQSSIMKPKMVKLLFTQWFLLTLQLWLPETLLLLVARVEGWGLIWPKCILISVALKKFWSFKLHGSL